jgi:putative glutamine amidotransferase
MNVGKKRIALSMRVTEAPDYKEPRDALSHDLSALFDAWGMLPVPVPNTLSEPATFLDELSPDLLVLTGGDDLGGTSERDETEKRLFAGALERNLPVLGICRGMHLINDHFGGRTQPVAGHVARPHGLRVDAEWSEMYSPETTVNSYHTKGIPAKAMGAELRAFAFDGAGNIEAFHHSTYPVAAVMWHPERGGAPAGDRELVARLIEERAFWA